MARSNMDLVKKYDALSVTAFIPWQGKVLLVLRSVHDNHLPGYWEQVGGKIDAGETLEEGLIREVQEEAGITVQPLHAYNEFEYTHFDGRSMCEIAYVCELAGEPKVILSSEHQTYQWLEPSALPAVNPMSDYMREVVRKGFTELR